MSHQASAIVNQGQKKANLRQGPHFSEDLGEMIALQLKELEGRQQRLPLTLNQEVQASVEYFLTDARKFMIRSLGRSTRYLPMIQGVLREKGLPPDLAYLALIESGYRVDAVSPANAVGLWQFIGSTGKRYGLQIDDFVDERQHPVKATKAAADYLAALHEIFGHWYLAAAAYNAGEGKILRGLKKYDAKDFWEIAGEDYLRAETKDYVPKFLAVVLIAKDPARYGLTEIKYEAPELYDQVEIPHPTDLEVIARLCGTSEEKIKELNPHLKLWCTPLNRSNYEVRIPFGTQTAFIQRYANMRPEELMRSSVHTVRSGESLRSIARRFNLSASTLAQFNNLGSRKLRKGQKLKLPVDAQVYMAKQKLYQERETAARHQLEKSGKKSYYTVRPGDNPWQIARNFDLHWKDIASWNNIKDVKALQPGQKLVLYLDKDSGGSKAPAKSTRVSQSKPRGDRSALPNSHTVQSGDTLWRIALKYKMDPEEIKNLNGLRDNSLRTGQVLKLKAALSKPKKITVAKSKDAESGSQGKSASSGRTYVVREGDTLWEIARKLGVGSDALLAANGKKNNSIRPGEVLKVPASAKSVKSANSKDGGATQKADKTSTSKKDKKTVSYRVKDGDTLWKIAQLFKVEPDQIRTWNSMKGHDIRPGDVLTIKANQS